MAKRSPRASIDPWNVQAEDDARRYGLTQLWMLITPLEAQALIDLVVSTRIQNECRNLLSSEIAREPRPKC